MLSFDEARAYLDSLAEELPRAFYKDLNGGVLLLPREKMSPEALAEDLYTLGEYQCSRAMGRSIVLYYGSFERLFGGAGDDAVRAELRKTLLHEFTHHLESLGGERGLEIEDEMRLRAYRRRHQGDK